MPEFASSRTLPERICLATLACTWAFYAIGGLYIVGPAVGWLLFALALLSLYLGPVLRPDLRPAGGVTWMIVVWGIGMLAMLLALWVAFAQWDLGAGEVIKSSIGWAKGWALLAIFPFAGAVLGIRRDCLIRGQCIIGLCTLLLLPMMLVAPHLGLPEKIFVSPLKAAGGPGPEYFTVYLYTIDPSNGSTRWQFYAPWSPFAGLLGVVMVLFALEDRKMFWRIAGILAGVAMIWFSKSRMSLVGLAACVAIPRLLPIIVYPATWKVLAGGAVSMAALGGTALSLVDDSVSAFKGARMDSTRVRETLQRIAYDRWSEAPYFGHGTVQPGPHLVEHMPIGSHHTWFGLLFVKGLTGLFALLVPLTLQLVVAAVDATRSPRGRLPLSLVLMLLVLTFGENVEIEAYLLWPVFLMLGIHQREMAAQQPA